MSGGSYNYAFHAVDDFASTLRNRHADDPLLLAFAHHLDFVSRAMHDVEWDESGDGADYATSVRAVITPTQEFAEAVRMAQLAISHLEHAVARVVPDLGREGT
jgi:hypothetical protein